MKVKDNLAKILIPILSILIAFIAGGIIILCLGKNPVEAYGYLFSGAFGSGRKMGQTLVIACPLIFTGLAAAFAYKCGVFNLGGEGQFIMGAVTSIFVSAKLGDAGMGGPSCKPSCRNRCRGHLGRYSWYFKDHQRLK